MREGWKYKKLGDICESDLGKTLNQSKDDGEMCPYLCAINVQWDKIDLSTLKTARFTDIEQEKYSVRKGDLLICEGGDIGRAAIWDRNTPFQYQNALHRVRFNGPAYYSRFYLLYLLFLKNKGILDTRYGKGVTIQHLVKSSLLSIYVPVPPLPEQERIVAEFDLLTGIIDKQKAQMGELDTLAQSIFYDMFGDPIENEKGWKTKEVIDIVKMQRGYDLPVQNRQSSGNIPIYGSNGMIGYHNIAMAQYGVITGRSGTLGKVYSSTIPFFPLNTTLFSVDTHGNNVIFLKYLLENYDLARFGTGTGVPTLNRNEFHNKHSIDIPFNLQESFAQKIQSIESQKESINRSIAETQKLFDYTMDKYFG